jgi:hypothetical protein
VIPNRKIVGEILHGHARSTIRLAGTLGKVTIVLK